MLNSRVVAVLSSSYGPFLTEGAALVAAAELDHRVKAVVTRGGRPDLAGSALPLVTAPTLLIVGELDYPVITMNRAALSQLRFEKVANSAEGDSLVRGARNARGSWSPNC